jgi:hypothetical protein
MKRLRADKKKICTRNNFWGVTTLRDFLHTKCRLLPFVWIVRNKIDTATPFLLLLMNPASAATVAISPLGIKELLLEGKELLVTFLRKCPLLFRLIHPSRRLHLHIPLRRPNLGPMTVF